MVKLTAKAKDEEIEEGFERGADDYITKPFKPKELVLRVQAVLRRAGVTSTDKMKYKDMVLDIPNRMLSIDNESIELSNLEFKLLHIPILNQTTT